MWVFDISAQKFENKRSAFEWLITALNPGQNNSEIGQKLRQDFYFFQLHTAKFGLKRTSIIAQEHPFKRKASTTVQHLLLCRFHQHPTEREFKTQEKHQKWTHPVTIPLTLSNIEHICQGQGEAKARTRPLSSKQNKACRRRGDGKQAVFLFCN